jgi:hypothetical protein
MGDLATGAPGTRPGTGGPNGCPATDYTLNLNSTTLAFTFSR